jgi:hypothetical protein
MDKACHSRTEAPSPDGADEAVSGGSPAVSGGRLALSTTIVEKQSLVVSSTT